MENKFNKDDSQSSKNLKDQPSPSVDSPGAVSDSRNDVGLNGSEKSVIPSPTPEIGKEISDFIDQKQAKSNGHPKNKNNRGSNGKPPKSKDKNHSGGNPSSKDEKNVNKVASSTTATILNKLTDQTNKTTADDYSTAGWRELLDGENIINFMIRMWHDSGIPTSNVLNHKQDLINQIKRWQKIYEAWANKSKDVYVLNEGLSDKGISSEVIWDNLFAQRRPFAQLSNGVPRIKAMVAPDIIRKLRYLNVSTNGRTANTYRDEEVVSYVGTLYQDLAGDDTNYQDRSINFVLDNQHYQSPGTIHGLRIPSQNTNIIGEPNEAPTADTNNNTLVPFEISLTAHGSDDIYLSSQYGASIELRNKLSSLRRIYNGIREGLFKFASENKDGDINWIAPRSLFANVRALSIPFNAVSDLKTFMYIINDAINGAMRSQFMQAVKTGTPESTFYSVTGKSAEQLALFNDAYRKLFIKMKNLPMNKDVIEKWNQHKHWSKIKESDITENDNSLVIPYFLLTRAGGGRYDDNFRLTSVDTGATTRLQVINPTRQQLRRALLLVVQKEGGGSFAIPQGDWFSMFMQSIVGRLSVDSFFRKGSSRSFFTATGNHLRSGSTSLTDASTIKGQLLTAFARTRTGAPTNEIQYQEDLNGSNARPDALGASNPTINNSCISTDLMSGWDKVNAYGDMLISYHSMTGFMQAFMELIVCANQRDLLNEWEDLFDIAGRFFSAFKSNEFDLGTYSIGDSIDVATSNEYESIFKEQPVYSLSENIETFYASRDFMTRSTNARGGFSYTPTRINFITRQDFNRLVQDYSRDRALGERWAIISKGKADRDVKQDNTLCTIADSDTRNTSTNYQNVFGEAVPYITKSYIASQSIIRPNAYHIVTQSVGVGPSNNRIFPILIGEHVNSYFYDELSYKKSGKGVRVSVLPDRPLVLDTSDDLTHSIYFGAWDQFIYSNIVHNMNELNKSLGLPLTNIRYVSVGTSNNQVMLNTEYQSYLTQQIIENYDNNSKTNVSTDIIQMYTKKTGIVSKEQADQRVLIGELVPVTTFSQL